jgi:hypothetical protein
MQKIGTAVQIISSRRLPKLWRRFGRAGPIAVTVNRESNQENDQYKNDTEEYQCSDE